MYFFRLITKRALSRLRSELLGRFATSIIYQSGKHRFALPAGDFSIGRHLGRKGEYQADELQQLLRICQGNDVNSACFVGSHVGYFVVNLSDCLDKVYAVEPNPGTRELLRLNLALNDCHNVELIPYAATEKDSTLEFWPSTENTGGSKVALQRASKHATYDRGQAIQVEGRALDDLNINADLLVIDVEGHEVPALRGMAKTLQSAKAVSCEIIPALTEAAGYSVAEQVNLLAKSFDKLYIDSDQSRPLSVQEVISIFANSSGDDRWISKNLICLRN